MKRPSRVLVLRALAATTTVALSLGLAAVAQQPALAAKPASGRQEGRGLRRRPLRGALADADPHRVRRRRAVPRRRDLQRHRPRRLRADPRSPRRSVERLADASTPAPSPCATRSAPVRSRPDNLQCTLDDGGHQVVATPWPRTVDADLRRRRAAARPRTSTSSGVAESRPTTPASPAPGFAAGFETHRQLADLPARRARRPAPTTSPPATPTTRAATARSPPAR